MKKIAYLFVSGLIILGLAGSLTAIMGCGASSKDDSAHATENKSGAVNIGNKICPVTDSKVDGKTTYEYEGKTYNLCCPMCIDEFKKNPEKYVKKIQQNEPEAGK